jgi:hypothetical protein
LFLKKAEELKESEDVLLMTAINRFVQKYIFDINDAVVALRETSQLGNFFKRWERNGHRCK